MATLDRYCICCGCTETTACMPPCSWHSKNVCTVCTSIHIRTPLDRMQAEALHQVYVGAGTPREGAALRRSMAAHLHASRMTVSRSGTGFSWKITDQGRAFLAAANRKPDGRSRGLSPVH